MNNERIYINWNYVLNYRHPGHANDHLEERIGTESKKFFKKKISQLRGDQKKIELYEAVVKQSSYRIPLGHASFTFEGNLLASLVRKFEGCRYCYEHNLKHPLMPDPDNYQSESYDYYSGYDNYFCWLEDCQEKAKTPKQRNWTRRELDKVARECYEDRRVSAAWQELEMREYRM